MWVISPSISNINNYNSHYKGPLKKYVYLSGWQVVWLTNPGYNIQYNVVGYLCKLMAITDTIKLKFKWKQGCFVEEKDCFSKLLQKNHMCITSTWSHKFWAGTKCSLYSRKITVCSATVFTKSLSLEQVKVRNIISLQITDLALYFFSFWRTIHVEKNYLDCPKSCANSMLW